MDDRNEKLKKQLPIWRFKTFTPNFVVVYVHVWVIVQEIVIMYKFVAPNVVVIDIHISIIV